jgi:hypothetical protein
MHMGMQVAGSPLRIQIWDEDGGFELGDDEITTSPNADETPTDRGVTLIAYVPACSSLNINTLRWPYPGTCIERFWVPLVAEAVANDYCSNEEKYPDAMCLLLEARIEAFGLKDEKTYLIATTTGTGVATFRDIGISAAVPSCGGSTPARDCPPSGETALSVEQKLGRAYGNAADMVYAEGITSAYNNMREVVGGLLLQASTQDRTYDGEKYAEFTATHGCEVFIFRSNDDYLSRTLGWMQRDGYVLDPLVKMQLRSGVGEGERYFRGLRRSMVNGGLLQMGGNNNVQGEIPIGSAPLDTKPYVMIIRQHVSTDLIEVVYSKEFDLWAFLMLVLQFGIANAFYAFLVSGFLQSISLRTECIPGFLAKAKESVENYGKDNGLGIMGGSKPLPNALGSLFLCYHLRQNDEKDPTNLEFRRNLYYATKAVYIIISLPFLLLVIFGVTCAATIKPPALGFALIFVGSAFFLLWLATRKWDAQGWRMTPEIARAFGLAYLLLNLYLMITPIVDPAVLFSGETVDLFSTAVAFFTLNLMPVMAVAFMNDPKLKKSMNQIAAAVSMGSKRASLKARFKAGGSLGLKMKQAMAKEEGTGAFSKQYDGDDVVPGHHRHKKKKHKIKKKNTFTKLVEDVYTVDSSMEAFKYSETGGSLVSGTHEEISSRTRKLYLVSLLILGAFVIFIYSRGAAEDRPSAIGACFTLIAIDSTFWLRFRGHCEWSPGYTTMLLVLTRGAVAIFLGEAWMVGAAGAYFVLGVALARDVVNFRFKIMSKYEIGAVAFFGKELRSHDEARARLDIAAMPEFCLGYLSAVFLLVLLAAMFVTGPENMPLLNGWPVYIYGIMAFFIVVFVAIGLTAARAFTLRSSNLYVSNSFFFTRSIKVPELLGIATYGWLIAAGFLISATSGSYSLLVLAVCVPIILLLGIEIKNTWQKNDFLLLHSWSRPRARLPKSMLAEDENEEEQSDPNAATQSSSSGAFGGFALPPLTRSGDADAGGLGGMGGALGGLFGGDAGLQMPALPMRTTMESANNGVGGGGDDEGSESDKEDAPLLVASKVSQYPRQEKGGWDVQSMSGITACYKGKLNADDYGIVVHIVLFVAMIFFSGFVLTYTQDAESYWVGYLFWSGIYTLACSYYVCKKWACCLEWTTDMTIATVAGFAALMTGALFLFLQVLQGDTNHTDSLFILMGIVYWPMFCVTAMALYTWHDRRYDTKSKALLVLYGVSPAWLMCFIVVMFWVNVFAGISLILTYLAAGLALILVRKWKRNGDWLPDSFRRFANLCMMFITAASWTIGLWLNDETLAFFISVGFVTLITKQVASVAGWYMARPPANSSPLYVSKFVFPMYSYDPATEQLVEETDVGFRLYSALATALAWGIFCIIFVNPVGLGVAITASVLLGVSVLTLFLVSLTPQTLGEAARCVDSKMIGDASTIAKEWFHRRRTIVVPQSAKWREHDQKEKMEKAMLDRYSSHTQDEEEEEDKEEEGRTTAVAAATEIQNRTRGMAYEDMASYYKGVRRFDAPFNFRDAVWDAFKTGHGPIAPLLGFGLPYKIYMKCIGDRKRRRAMQEEKQKLLEAPADEGANENGDAGGKKKNAAGDAPDAEGMAIKHKKSYVVRMEEGQLEAHHRDDSVTKTYGPLRDTCSMLSHLPELNDHLDQEFEEETRMMVHFQVLLVLSSFSKIEKETTLFQMFLRENRFKLLANGVKPPPDIFKSSSFATIDVSLVANWLIRLTPEQHQRFMQLKDRFATELENREMIRGMEDKMMRDEIKQAHEQRAHWDWQQFQKHSKEAQDRRAARLDAGDDLPDGVPEDVQNCNEFIEEIRQGLHGGLKNGLYDREEQWIDPSFLHNEDSIGYCEARPLVKNWHPAAAINQDMHMFYEGTDPDDVHQGILHDGWLLSAIQILAASGGVGDNDVDPLVKNLFAHCFGAGNSADALSDIGAYGVRLHKNGTWETIVVDDFFPTLDDEYKDSKCKGVAFGYTTNMEEMWVSLLEKAYAKYYGSYAALQTGFPHFALEDLTGCKSEALSIMQESSGARKALFWRRLQTYYTNRYLMGAGSISSDSADREVLDSGLIFGATYVVLEIVEENGHKLVQLRNPPGDHGEWQGDWGDESALWTRYMKRKLNYSDDADDGCFWMSFDDFCQSFRTLFVGYHYDEDKWSTVTWDEWWKVDDGTSQGLPTRHNPECILQENPQFAITIDRPTDLCLTMSQTEKGTPISEPLEAMFLLYKPPKPIGLAEAPTESVRVEKMEASGIIASSGQPQAEREMTISVHVPPGHYTILCAAYKTG